VITLEDSLADPGGKSDHGPPSSLAINFGPSPMKNSKWHSETLIKFCSPLAESLYLPHDVTPRKFSGSASAKIHADFKTDCQENHMPTLN